jgi:anti-sigma B factor antagonist
MRLGIRSVGDVTIVTPKGMYLGGPETDELDRKLDELIRGGARKILVNLGQTTYVSSAPLAILIATLNQCDARGIGLKLCCLDRKINLVLIITRLVMRFDTYDSEEDALASFGIARPMASPAQSHGPRSAV